MKSSTVLYVAGIVLLLAVCVLLQHNAPRRFSWKATFHHFDNNPYGCAVFDSVLTDAMPCGYKVTDSTFYSLDRADTTRVCHVLAISDFLYMNDKDDRQALFHMVGRGCKVVLVSEYIDTWLNDTLGFEEATPPIRYVFDTSPFYVQESERLTWKGDSLRYASRDFEVPTPLWSGDFRAKDSCGCPYPYEVVVERTECDDSVQAAPVALSICIGKGELWLVRTPKLFTNYGILDVRYTDYVFRFLTRLQDAPLIRTQAYCSLGYARFEQHRVDNEGRPLTPLSYFQSQTPLRWALRLGFILVVVFLCFTARRKQRPIPVMSPPSNMGLDFIKLIGTLYFRRESPTALVRKKYVYFAEEIRRRTWIDLNETSDVPDLCERLSAKTGIESARLVPLIQRLHAVVRSEAVSVDIEEMKYLTDRMNDIVQHL